MQTLIVFHEVDDVARWLASPERAKLFGPSGITVRTFADPKGSNKTGVVIETPDMATFENVMQSEAAAAAMKVDGIRPETVLVMVEK